MAGIIGFLKLDELFLSRYYKQRRVAHSLLTEVKPLSNIFLRKGGLPAQCLIQLVGQAAFCYRSAGNSTVIEYDFYECKN